MDCVRIGALLASLRREKGMTQRAVASLLGVSDKAVSKWKCGMGCPDLSLLTDLSRIFGVNIGDILSGELPSNEKVGGNMKKVEFYRCAGCGNLITATGGAEISCCGRRLERMMPATPQEEHLISAEMVEDEWFVTVRHPMAKRHYITALALVTADRLLLTKLYPEQEAQARFKRCGKGTIYALCSEHGLFTLPVP